MNSPYENIAIENFLFGLGMRLRDVYRSKEANVEVSLLQQTPLDTALGNILLGTGGVSLLIEFKREENKSNKENKKSNRIISLINSIDSDSVIKEISEISEKIHWQISSTALNKDKHLTFSCKTYLLQNPLTEKDDGLEKIIDLVVKMLHGGGDKEINTNLINEYLKILVKANMNESGSYNSGGIAIRIEQNGNFMFSVIDRFSDLKLSPRDITAKILTQTQSPQHTLSTPAP